MRRYHTIVLAIASLGLVPVTAAPAMGTPPETGCSSANQVLVVADLVPLGYMVPQQVDDPANGGNGNGLVCGKPFNPVVQQLHCPADTCPVPVVYYFRDDNLTRK